MEHVAARTPTAHDRVVSARSNKDAATPLARTDRASAARAAVGNQAVLRQDAARESTPASVLATMRTPGRALGPSVRATMETAFGADFSDVRVHDDHAAVASARDVGARAYSVGRHIVLPADQLQQPTLLAHELTHVVQGGADRLERGIVLGGPNSLAEREADLAGGRVASGMPISVATAPSHGGAAILRRALDNGPGGRAIPLSEADRRITPHDALAQARRLLTTRTAQGREDVRDFKLARDESLFTGMISDTLGSITHHVTPTTLGDYEHVDFIVEEAVAAGRRLDWPVCGRLLSEAAFEVQRLERQMVEAREGADAGADLAVDLLRTIQVLAAVIGGSAAGAAAGYAVAGEAAATAPLLSVPSLATAAATGGTTAVLGMANETAGQVTEISIGARRSISTADILKRGVTEFVGNFFGHFISGALTRALGNWLGRYASRELVASGLPARALVGGEHLAVELLSGALATPVTTALTTVAARPFGDRWPTAEEFVDQVMNEIPRNVLMSVLMQAAPHPTRPASPGPEPAPILRQRPSAAPTGEMAGIADPNMFGTPSNTDVEVSPNAQPHVLAATGTYEDAALKPAPRLELIHGGKSDLDAPHAMSGPPARGQDIGRTERATDSRRSGEHGSTRPLGERDQPGYRFSESDMVEYFRIAMPKGEWVGETQWFDGKQIAVTRKQLLATKPDAYSEAFQVALENKKYDLANPAWGYASLIETLTGSSPSRGGGVGKLKTTPQMAQRANGMPEETRHWLVLDARRQRILDPGTFAASLRRDLGTGNIFERFFLRLDDGMHEFPWE